MPLRSGNRLFTVPENIGNTRLIRTNQGLWLVLQGLKIKLKTGSVFEEPVSFPVFCFELAGDDVGRTRTFFALSDLKLHLLAFVKRGVAAHLDFRMMNEQILAGVVGSDKSKTFASVKPFYCTCTHFCAPLAI